MLKGKGAVRNGRDGTVVAPAAGSNSVLPVVIKTAACENGAEACMRPSTGDDCGLNGGGSCGLGNGGGSAVLLPYDGFPAVRLVLAARMTARLRGLLMSPASDAVLMLAPCRDIHTFGMGYAIDVAFVDEAGAVLQSQRDVLPNRRLRNCRASAVLERFAMPQEVWFEEGDRLAIGAFRVQKTFGDCSVRSTQ